MNSVWDSTISERLSNGTSVIDELFKCIGDYNTDCALRLLHPSRFDGKDMAFELREGFSWCKDNVQSFCRQVLDYPLKSRVQDLFRMITILMRDYDKQLAHDDIDPKGQIWYCMNLVYQFGQELLSQRGLNVPPNVQGILYRSITLPEPSPSPSVQATTKDDATLPDFPMTESIMSALYSLLTDKGVINVDEPTFTYAITHANMKELWDEAKTLRKRNQLRCVIRHLKDRFDTDWLACVIDNGLPENITSFNRDTIGDFEHKVRAILR